MSQGGLARSYTFPVPALGSLRTSGSFLWRMTLGNQDLKSSPIGTGVVLLLGHLRDEIQEAQVSVCVQGWAEVGLQLCVIFFSPIKLL